MGLDAQMLCRIPDEVSDEQIREWSHRLCASFGRYRFEIEYRTFEFENPKYPQNPETWSETDFGPRHVLTRVPIWTECSPSISPEPGETFLVVNLSGQRYYGPGYERGDFPFIYMLCKWLEDVIPDCEIWYGGDDHAAPFGRDERESLWHHFLACSTDAYLEAFQDGIDPVPEQRPTCPMCGTFIPRISHTVLGKPVENATYRCVCGITIRSEDGVWSIQYGTENPEPWSPDKLK